MYVGLGAAGEARAGDGRCPPSSNDCCVASPNATPGCADSGCCEIVCAFDSFCCNEQFGYWDAFCAKYAQDLCPACGGGGGVCPASDNDCCVATQTPGCNNAECCEAVCTNFAYCCDTAWDSACVSDAQVLCPECRDGGGWAVCGSPDAGDCCIADGTIACSDAECCNTVCAADPFCCKTNWDALCAMQAQDLCAVCKDIVDPLEGWSIDVTPSPAPFTNALLDVHAISAADVWAVGYYDLGDIQALAIHWDGKAWTQSFLPEVAGQESLAGLGGTGAGDVWAVGATFTGGAHSTVVLHFDGEAWSIIPSPNPDPVRNILNAVFAISPTDAWAVGYQGDWETNGQSPLAMHWDGESWEVVATPVDPFDDVEDLASVFALAPDDVWAVGTTGVPDAYEFLVLHYDGKAWQQVTDVPQSGDYGRELGGIVAFAPDDVWFAGHATFDGLGDRGVILHFDGAQWHETVPFCQFVCSLWDIAGGGPTDLLATGEREIGGPDLPQAYRSEGIDGEPWTYIDLEEIDGNGTGHTRGVAVLPTGEAWIVGWRTRTSFVQQTRVYHYVPPSSPPPVRGDVDGDGVVDGTDLGMLLAAWGQAGGQADLNADGIVSGGDLGILLANWS